MLVVLVYNSFEVMQIGPNFKLQPLSLFRLQIPYVLIFIGPNCNFNAVDNFNLACDILFMADILVNFNSAFLDESAILIKDHKSIAKRYLRSSFSQSNFGAAQPLHDYNLAVRRVLYLCVPQA